MVINISLSTTQSKEWIFFKWIGQNNWLFLRYYDNHGIIGDFNLEPSTGLLKHFMNNNAIYNLIKVNTCFKGKGTCIDSILTNRKYSFKNTNTFETGLSDHHHMIYTMLKSTVEKAEPIKLIYRDYKNFSFDFKADLENALKSCPNSYDSFEQCFSSKLNEYAPKKTKWVRGNNKSHMNKFLRRAIC